MVRRPSGQAAEALVPRCEEEADVSCTTASGATSSRQVIFLSWNTTSTCRGVGGQAGSSGIWQCWHLEVLASGSSGIWKCWRISHSISAEHLASVLRGPKYFAGNRLYSRLPNEYMNTHPIIPVSPLPPIPDTPIRQTSMAVHGRPRPADPGSRCPFIYGETRTLRFPEGFTWAANTSTTCPLIWHLGVEPIQSPSYLPGSFSSGAGFVPAPVPVNVLLTFPIRPMPIIPTSIPQDPKPLPGVPIGPLFNIPKPSPTNHLTVPSDLCPLDPYPSSTKRLGHFDLNAISRTRGVGAQAGSSGIWQCWNLEFLPSGSAGIWKFWHLKVLEYIPRYISRAPSKE
ncbi:hypothetical protein J6590_074504 [Homalodisca vitripennis]|nr:hypothetical protein J6590_074504 [Homalodisca vitripennis]